MSTTKATGLYRREDRTTLRVPVVMPLVEVCVDSDGGLTVLLNREPYSADGALCRDDLRRVLDEIASDLGTPLRVEVREADGATFTDIITPPLSRPRAAELDIEPAAPVASVAPAAPSSRPCRTALVSAFGITGHGFTAEERVEVCVVVAHQVADGDGTVRLRLPPALLAQLVAEHPTVVLVGRSSGAVAVSSDPELDTGASPSSCVGVA